LGAFQESSGIDGIEIYSIDDSDKKKSVGDRRTRGSEKKTNVTDLG
jgi:hypothetical protein